VNGLAVGPALLDPMPHSARSSTIVLPHPMATGGGVSSEPVAGGRSGSNLVDLRWQPHVHRGRHEHRPQRGTPRPSTRRTAGACRPSTGLTATLTTIGKMLRIVGCHRRRKALTVDRASSRPHGIVALLPAGAGERGAPLGERKLPIPPSGASSGRPEVADR
jgi:hypothetical protein